MSKGIPNKRYTGEFKQEVVETMHRDTGVLTDVALAVRFHELHGFQVQCLRDIIQVAIQTLSENFIVLSTENSITAVDAVTGTLKTTVPNALTQKRHEKCN